jgi:ribose transport system ATP-binding protein
VSGQPVIEFRNITKTFPGVAALRDVSFSIERGEVHALVGENGAGKSTLIKILSGVQQADSGQILFDGTDARIGSPSAAFDLGITSIYQELPLARSLSIADNIFLGQELTRSAVLRRAEQNRIVSGYFREFGIDIDPRTQVEKLSVSMQQITAIIKAMTKEAKLFIMDEPTATLGEHEVERLFDFIGRIKRKGITVLYISHRLDEIFGIADRVTVIRDGSYMGTRRVADLNRAELVTLMSGRNVEEHAGCAGKACGEPVLEVRRLGEKRLLRDVSFTLHRGEIFGLTGLVGAGKTELLECIYGLRPVTAGEILLAGGPGRSRGAPRRIASESFPFGFVPEDRKRKGLFLELDLVRNISISCLRYLVRLSWVLRGREAAMAQGNVRDLDIRTRGIRQRVKFLSGGNQQKVILARWLNSRRQVLLLDEPTRGVDVMAKGEIYRLMDRLAAQGMTILVSSCDVGEVLAVSDRVATIRNGRLVRIYDRGQFSKERVLHDILFDAAAAEEGVSQ